MKMSVLLRRGRRLTQTDKTGRILSGLGVGAANGLFGGGGGMIAVPLLSAQARLNAKQAHATAILVIAPLCLVSAIIYSVNGYFSVQIVIPAAIDNVAGGLVGAALLDKLPPVWVKISFVAVMLAAGIRMVIG